MHFRLRDGSLLGLRLDIKLALSKPGHRRVCFSPSSPRHLQARLRVARVCNTHLPSRDRGTMPLRRRFHSARMPHPADAPGVAAEDPIKEKKIEKNTDDTRRPSPAVCSHFGGKRSVPGIVSASTIFDGLLILPCDDDSGMT